MHASLWSTITLLTELGLTAVVYYTIYEAYRKNFFHTWLAVGALTYETLFNITYMARRFTGGLTEHAEVTNPYTTALAIFHGTFSLIMFISLVVFFTLAIMRYRKGENFFAVHETLTVIFTCAWTVSIFSGMLLFVDLYLV